MQVANSINIFNNISGFINDFLSNYLFRILSRLSFSMFLIHFLLLKYEIGILRALYITITDYEMVSIKKYTQLIF